MSTCTLFDPPYWVAVQCTIHNTQYTMHCSLLQLYLKTSGSCAIMALMAIQTASPMMIMIPKKKSTWVETWPSDWQLPPLTSTWHTSTADNLPRLEQEEVGFQTHLLQKAWSEKRSAYMDWLLNYKPVLYSLKLIVLALFFNKKNSKQKNKKRDTWHVTMVGDEHSLKMSVF